MAPIRSYDYLFKYLLIGDSDVGKTCILFRFCDDAFNQTFISTIGIDFKIKTVEVDGKRIKLQIWDTAGQERFQTITTSYYRGASGIMLVYDIANRRSFSSLIEWIKNIREHAGDDVEIIVLANKHDLEAKRMISTEEGKALAVANRLQYIETSAKENINIEKAFMDLTRAVLTKTLGEETEEAHDNHVNLQAETGSSSCC